MPILGVNVKEISFEKKDVLPTGPQIQVNLTPKIEEIREAQISTPTGNIRGIEVLFTYELKYNPEIASGKVSGGLFYLPINHDQMEGILKTWREEKRVDPMVFTEIVNFLTHELAPTLMLISKQMGLPYPFPLPLVQFQVEKKEE